MNSRRSAKIRYFTRVASFDDKIELTPSEFVSGNCLVWRPTFSLKKFKKIITKFAPFYNQVRLVRVRVTLLPTFHEPTLDDARSLPTLDMPRFFVCTQKNDAEFLKTATGVPVTDMFSLSLEDSVDAQHNWKPISLTHSRTFITRPHAVLASSPKLKDGGHTFARSRSPWLDIGLDGDNDDKWASYSSLCILITKFDLGNYSVEQANALGKPALKGSARSLKFRVITRYTWAMRKVHL